MRERAVHRFDLLASILRAVSTVLRWTITVLFGLAFLYPLVWLLSASLKPRGDVFDNRLIPRTFAFENYTEVWKVLPLASWVLNSVFIAVAAATLITFSSSMVAFGLAYHYVMVAALVMTLPMMILFAFGQRYVIEGIATGSVKG